MAKWNVSERMAVWKPQLTLLMYSGGAVPSFRPLAAEPPPILCGFQNRHHSSGDEIVA